jgi:hypothetical protein
MRRGQRVLQPCSRSGQPRRGHPLRGAGGPIIEATRTEMAPFMDLFNTYRKMFASLDDEPVVWWYCGGVTAPRLGVGSVPHVQAETIMAYRTRSLSADRFTIDWTEVGYFRDITTGEPLQGWFNPFTQLIEPYPKTFVDGPATFTVSRVGDGIAVELVQHNARVDGVQVAVCRSTASVGLVQTETKTRTYHRPDGSLPPLDSPEATQIETVLSIWSPLAAVDDAAVHNTAAHGFYRSGSRATANGQAAGGSWAATVVAGTMRKGRADERVNPQAWQRLQQRFPDFFDGDKVAQRFD